MNRLLAALISLLIHAVTVHAELPSATTATVNQTLVSGKPTVIDLALDPPQFEINTRMP